MDGVMHPSVEQAIGRDRIRKAFKRYENNPADEHDRGIVRAVNSDGSYEVLLDGDVQTARCAPYAKAMVGDRVIVVTTKDGENVLLGRLGGETETIMPTIDERFEALEGEAPIASGTSGDWEWIKFASGLAICAGSIAFNNISFTAWGSVFEGVVGKKSYPFAFVTRPKITYSAELTGGNAIMGVEVGNAGTATETPFFYAIQAVNTVVGSGYVHVQAIGRWK